MQFLIIFYYLFKANPPPHFISRVHNDGLKPKHGHVLISENWLSNLDFLNKGVEFSTKRKKGRIQQVL